MKRRSSRSSQSKATVKKAAVQLRHNPLEPRARSERSRGEKSSIAANGPGDRLAQPGVLKAVTISDVFTPAQQKTLNKAKLLPKGWQPNWWFAVQDIPLERLRVAAKAVGKELPETNSDSIEMVHNAVGEFRKIAGRFQPVDIRHRWFSDLASLLDQRAKLETLANSNLEIELTSDIDPPALLREKALRLRQQARTEAKTPLVRDHLLDLAKKAECRAFRLEQGIITPSRPELTEFEKRHFERLSAGKITISGSLPLKSPRRKPEITDPLLEQGRMVLAKIVATNPSVEAFRDAMRKAGIKGSNQSFGMVLSALKAELKK